jgi:hypothetical protein
VLEENVCPLFVGADLWVDLAGYCFFHGTGLELGWAGTPPLESRPSELGLLFLQPYSCCLLPAQLG